MHDEHFSPVTASFELSNVDEVTATVTLTARVRFWREAVKNLKSNPADYGAWQVIAAINSVVRQAEASFYEEVKSEKP